MALKYVSFSALNMFDECALRYNLARIKKVPEPVSKALVSGILVHEVASDGIEYANTEQIDTVPLSIVDDIVTDVFKRNERVDSTQFFDDVMATSRIFFRKYRHDPTTVVELEMRIEEPVLGEGNPNLLGFLDRLDRYEDHEGPFLGVTDMKSGWGAEQSEANRFQLQTQGLLVKGRFPDERVKVRNQFLRADYCTEWVEIKPWDMENTVRRAVAILERQERAFKTRAYPANPGKHCTYCGYAAQCAKALDLAAGFNKALTLEDAQTQLRSLVVLEAAVKQIKASLKEYADANGRVLVDIDEGKVSAGYKSPKPSLTIADLPLAYERLGEDLWGLVAPAAAKLKTKKVQEDPRLAGLWLEKQGKPSFHVGAFAPDAEEEEA